MTSLFDIEAYSSPTSKPAFTHDPYWDEIVLEPGAIEGDGQVSLLYDDSQEPPDPDDFPSLADFYQGWDEWVESHPEISTSGFSDKQQVLFDTAKEQNDSCGTSLDRCVGEQQTKKTAHQHTQFVEEYYVLRSRKPYYYYRHVWMQGRRQVRTYIGSSRSIWAIAIKERVMEAIAAGDSPIKIQQIIKSAKSR